MPCSRETDREAMQLPPGQVVTACPEKRVEERVL